MGKQARFKQAALTTVNMDTDLSPEQLRTAALHISVAMASLDACMSKEKKLSARWNRLFGALESATRCLDLYRLERFSYEDMRNAESLFDTVNDKIKELYP